MPQTVRVVRNDLIRALSLLAPALPKRNTLPILSGVMMYRPTKSREMILTLTDLAVSVQVQVSVSGDDSFHAVIAFSSLLRAVKLMQGENLTLEADRWLTVADDSDSVDVILRDAGEFPLLPECINTIFRTRLEGRLLDMLLNNAPAFAVDENSFENTGLKGVFLLSAKGGDDPFMELFASDTHRAIVAQFVAKGGRCQDERTSISIPARALRIAANVVRITKTEWIDMESDGNLVVFRWDGGSIVSKLYEATCPNYHKILDVLAKNDPPYASIVVKRQNLLDALKRGISISNSKGCGFIIERQKIRLYFNDDFPGFGYEMGAARCKITVSDVRADSLGSPMNFNLRTDLNPRFVRDALSNLPGEYVRWDISSNPAAPSSLRSCDVPGNIAADGPLMLLMPMVHNESRVWEKI